LPTPTDYKDGASSRVRQAWCFVKGEIMKLDWRTPASFVEIRCLHSSHRFFLQGFVHNPHGSSL